MVLNVIWSRLQMDFDWGWECLTVHLLSLSLQITWLYTYFDWDCSKKCHSTFVAVWGRHDDLLNDVSRKSWGDKNRENRDTQFWRNHFFNKCVCFTSNLQYSRLKESDHFSLLYIFIHVINWFLNVRVKQDKINFVRVWFENVIIFFRLVMFCI